MFDGKIHGTDCFEVDSFLQKNGSSKIYWVRHKASGKFYTMEVSPRGANSKAPISPYIQETMNVLSEFWLNLRFTFQTRSKFYYILDSAGTQTLSQLVKSSGCLPESAAKFYASEVLVSLEEFHRARLVYKELALDSVFLDSDGHVIMWRSFCDKYYWSKLECVCSLSGFHHGDPCNNNHDLNVDFKQDWVAFGYLLSAMLAGESYGQTTTHYPNSKQATVLPSSVSVSASDVIRRLVRGEISQSEQILSHPFFKDVDWREVRKRNSKAPRFPLNLRSEQVQSSANSLSINSSYYRQQYNASLSSSPRWRPHSSSLQSAPVDLRYNESAPNYLVPRPSLHSTLSSPDLGSWCRSPPNLQHHVSLSASSMRYHLEATNYASTNVRDFESATKRQVEKKPLLSRSLFDIASSAGSDVVFGLQSPALLQRTFVNPNFHGTPSSGGTQDFRIWDSSFVRSGSQTDLSGSHVPWNPPYHGSHSERCSPTPSQCSDNNSYSSYSPDTSPRRPFDSPNQSLRSSKSDNCSSTKQNCGALEYQTLQRSSSRESEDHSGIPNFPVDYRRGYFSFHSKETRPIENSRPRSELQKNRLLAQQNVLANGTKEILQSNRRDEISGTSDEFRRERKVSLSRTHSCSVLGDEKQRSEWNTSSSNQRRDSLPLDISGPRERYPLAQLPIPSFGEFKRRNASNQTESGSTFDKDKTSQESPDGAAKVASKQDEKRESEANGKNRLSSLYESVKDICGHTKAKPLTGSGNYLNVPNELKADAMERKVADASEGSKSTRKYSRSRQDSPFSKNEVIHQLMLKYGLYEKCGHRQTKSPTNETRIVRAKSDGSGVKEKRHADSQSQPSRSKLSPGSVNEKETFSSSIHSSAPKSPRSPRATDKTIQRSAHKMVESTNQERRKSASEILKELRQKNRFVGETTKPLDSSPIASQSKTNKSTLQHGNETTSSEMDNSNSGNRSPSNENPGNDLDSKMADILKARLAVIRNRAVTKETDKSDEISNNSGTVLVEAKSPRSMYGTSRTILCAAKFKRAKNKAGIVSTGSPLPEKKTPEKIAVSNDASAEVTNCPRHESVLGAKETNDTKSIEIKSQSSIDQPSPSTDHRRLCVDKSLRKRGIHTSMLSIASSVWSRDADMDDTSSICSETDLDDGGRGTRGRRWHSFYSNTSADSGSAQMFEYETDSAATEDDDQEYRDDHPNGEVDVKRADSGVGGDLGQSPMRRSLEEIMQKSSEHWSVVAASARHWQELARRRKMEASGPRSPKKKSSFTITEDMVECPDCLKYYVPQKENEKEKEKENAKSPEICSKCKDRRVERKEAIIELVQTEINYGNDLQVLKEEFYIPMQSGGILSPDNLAAMFLNLQELLEVNSKFCAKLQKSLEHSVAKGDEEFAEVNVGSIFLESVDFFQAYEIYCSKQNAASALLDSLQKKTELLRIFLNVTCRENPKCRKMDLNSFILAPVQRIMKYPLLLNRICKASPRTNADREKLKMAQRKIEEQLNKINALNTTVESRQRRYRTSQQLGRSDSLDKVQMKKMACEILNWTMEEMQLLMHGAFQVNIHEFGTSWNRRGSKKALSVCVLFCVRGHSEHIRIDSDEEGECEEPLFPGEGEVTGASLVLLRKKTNGKYTLFKDPLPLDMCVVYRDCERKDSFELMLIGKESYVFKATSARECRRWLKYLRIESKNLGAWKRRRNGLPNIMIKSL